MELRVLDLDLGLKNEASDCWTYRGEGNANVILALDGQNKVLRLKKSLKSENSAANFKYDNKKVDEKLINNTIISNGISDSKTNATQDEQTEISRSILERCIWETRWWKTFTKLLGTCYTIRDYETIEIVDLTSCNIAKLNEKLEFLRPPSRRHKLIASEYAVMFPDFTLMPETDYLCYGDTFTFELKPKHGWTPYVINLNESSEYAKCPYCLTQFLKFKKGKIDKISGYCPLDLFSGADERMNKAVKCIIEVPQNNFKVFRNGHAVDHGDLNNVLEDLFKDNPKVNSIENNAIIPIEEDTINESDINESHLNVNKKFKKYHNSFSNLNKLTNLIRATLIKDFNPSKEVSNDFSVHNGIIHYDSSKMKYLQKLQELGLESCRRNCEFSTLPKGCILERLLRLQLLDCDVVLENLSKGTGYEYIEGTLKVLESGKGSLNSLTDLERSMMAATVKDCSIMLTFRRVKDVSNRACNFEPKNISPGSDSKILNNKSSVIDEIVESNGQRFMSRVSVIDLDLKPESRIDNYLKHIQDMFEACLEFLTNLKRES